MKLPAHLESAIRAIGVKPAPAAPKPAVSYAGNYPRSGEVDH